MNRPHLRWSDYDNNGDVLPDGYKRLKDGTIVDKELEARAHWICCPMCDRDSCNRYADDCDVKKWIEKEKNDVEM